LTKFCHPSFRNGKLVAEVKKMAEVARKVITWEDYLQGEPKDLECYEIEDGEVIVVGAPSGEHQWVIKVLLRVLDDFVTSRQSGVVIQAPFDVVVQRDPVRTRQPDLLFLRKERGGTPEQIRQLKRLEISPDIAIEVVSASEEETERLERKLRDYHRIGVPEVWLVYPEERAVEVLVWAEDGWRWHGLFFSKDKIRSTILGETDFAVGRIFE
jgi:Uma2 family endonuclease